MELKFTGSLSEIRSEMEEFLGGAAGINFAAKVTKTSKKAEVINADSLRELMLGIADKDGKKKVLADFGVSKISDIDADQVEAVYAEMKKLS
jgi:hypothetical protein